MFRDRVVAHYVHRGYKVEADKIINGESGSPHRVDLACHSDLGDLIVFFGDEDPLEGPELGSIKRAAADLAAGAVVAVPEANAHLKAAAREHRVILLEEATLDGPAEEEPLIEAIEDGGTMLAREPTAHAEAAITEIPVPADDVLPADRVGAFDWLPEDEPAVAIQEPRKAAGVPLHWIWGPLLYLTATLVLVVVGAILFL